MLKSWIEAFYMTYLHKVFCQPVFYAGFSMLYFNTQEKELLGESVEISKDLAYFLQLSIAKGN